jgi:hypothetical protein
MEETRGLVEDLGHSVTPPVRRNVKGESTTPVGRVSTRIGSR